MVKIRIWLNAWIRVEDRERAMVSVNTIKIVIINKKNTKLYINKFRYLGRFS